VANHRAAQRGSRRRPVDVPATSDVEHAPRSPAAPGRRRAVTPARRGAVRGTSTHTGSRKTLIPGIPSGPTLVGVAALALAAAGAVTMGGTHSGSAGSGNIQRLSAQASVLSGASNVGSSTELTGRERAVSRDSEREALADAADQQLQAAAERQAKQRNAALQALAASAEKQATLIAKNIWQLPVTRGVYHLTSRFGDCSGLWAHCHTGLDFAAPSGTPIHAIAPGVVSEVGYAGAYGNRTIETLADGTEIWYAHQTAYAVTAGQPVRAGDVIGSVGSTGNVTGPHVHIEVRPGAGDPVDPFTAFIAHGVTP